MYLLFAILLLLSFAASAKPAIGQDTADGYEQHLHEYDQRVADARQWETEQQWKRWLPLLVVFAFMFVLIVYSQVAARRRFYAAMMQSQQNVDRTVEQHQEVIDLLRSIDERLGKRA